MFEDVVKVNVYLILFEDFVKFNEVYFIIFIKNFFVRIMVEVKFLSGVFIEVDVIAVKEWKVWKNESSCGFIWWCGFNNIFLWC